MFYITQHQFGHLKLKNLTPVKTERPPTLSANILNGVRNPSNQNLLLGEMPPF